MASVVAEGASVAGVDHEQAPSVTPGGKAVLLALLLSTIFLQRLGIPLGAFAVPLILPLGLGALAVLVLRGDVRPVPQRLALYLAVAAALAITSYLSARYSTEVHLTSLLIVLAIWSPWVLRARGDAVASLEAFRWTGRAFTRTMIGLSIVGVAQLGSQFLGLWQYQDLLGQFLPSELLIPGYNTSIPIAWDSPIHKAQAFVFLEPSVFSQFTAVAIIMAILLRAPLWQVLVLALGLVSALSGTGMLVLVVGLVLLVLRAPSLIRPVYIVAGGLALAAALISPASEILFGRVGELNSQTSSLSLRFVVPYAEVEQGLEVEPRRWVSGAGPGASDRLLESGRVQAGLEVVYTVPAKLLFEYGLVAAATFLTFLMLTLFRAPPAPVLPGTMLVWLFFMGGYLASPFVVWAIWLLSPVWSPRE